MQAGRQAGGRAGRRAGRRAGDQAGGRAGGQAASYVQITHVCMRALGAAAALGASTVALCSSLLTWASRG